MITMTKSVNALEPIMFNPSIIHLTGDRLREAYRNYVRVRWGRDPEINEYQNFYQNHPTAYAEMVQDERGNHFMYILFH